MKRKLLMILVAVIAIVSMFTLVACGGNDGNTTNGDTTNPNQLAIVKNVKYDEDNYNIMWDKVTGADSYNVKVTTDNVTFEGIKVNELEFYPKNADKKLSIEVQAVDSTGVKDNSKWSTAYAYTLTKSDTLLSNIMDYAKDNINGSLKRFVSAYTYVGRYNSKILMMEVVSALTMNNKYTNDAITTITAEIDENVELTSLNDIVKSIPDLISSDDKNLAVDNNGKPINSMDSLLASDITSTYLHKNYISKGYTVDVISSYTSIDNKYDTVGKDFTVHGVLKLTRGTDIKYASYECGCSLKGQNATRSLEDNVTNGFSREHSLYEGQIQLLTGDFAEAAKLSTNVTK